MKILHTVTSLQASGGGVSEYVPRLCQELLRRGNEVRIVTGKTEHMAESVRFAIDAGVDYREFPEHEIPAIRCFCTTPEYRRAIVEGVKWCDIVHIHGLWQDPGWTAVRAARKLEKPFVIQPHGFLEPERLKKSALPKRVIGSIIERPNLNRANAVIATAKSEKEGITQYGIRNRIEVVPIGIDTTLIDSASPNNDLIDRLRIDPHKKILLYFSRLAPIKGLDMLAEAWSMLDEFHDDWQLCIAGPGEHDFVAKVKKWFLSDIHDNSVVFPGPIYGRDKYDLLKCVDAFVLPTKSENFGIAVQEALAAGLPTVCTKGAPWELIESEDAGAWVDINAAGIREGLRKILSVDDAERTRMGMNGVNLIARYFGWDIVVSKILEVYRCCIGK